MSSFLKMLLKLGYCRCSVMQSRRHWQSKVKCHAFAQFAYRPDAAAMGLHNVLDDREAEARCRRLRANALCLRGRSAGRSGPGAQTQFPARSPERRTQPRSWQGSHPREFVCRLGVFQSILRRWGARTPGSWRQRGPPSPSHPGAPRIAASHRVDEGSAAE